MDYNLDKIKNLNLIHSENIYLSKFSNYLNLRIDDINSNIDIKKIILDGIIDKTNLIKFNNN